MWVRVVAGLCVLGIGFAALAGWESQEAEAYCGWEKRDCTVFDNCKLAGVECHRSYNYALNTATAGDWDNATEVYCAWVGIGGLYELCIIPVGYCGGPRATPC